MSNIDKTLAYLLETFENSNTLANYPEQKSYRVEHTIRVANIGSIIAKEENLNHEALVIGCLLHDIAYAKMDGNWIEHGRISADMARDFLSNLGLDNDVIEDICYGIAIHVDGKSHFEGNETVLASSISDADNIDRFDAYRIYEGLQYQKFNLLSLAEKKEFVSNKLINLNKYLNVKLSTTTATKMWQEKISFQIKYFELLNQQLETSAKLT